MSVPTRVLVSLGVIAAVAVGIAVTVTRDHSARLRIDDSVAPDFRELADRSWDLFVAAFAGRSDCFGDVTLSASSEIGDLATYQPGEARVLVRVPGSAGRLGGALIHEFAHHVEFQCAAHARLRPEFLAAQGLDPATPWFEGDTWASTPSEQYAEATIEYVLGDRLPLRGLVVAPGAVATVAEWAAGG